MKRDPSPPRPVSIAYALKTVVVLSSLTLISMGSLHAETPPQKEPVTVKIGLASSLTGPSAHLGKDLQLGAQMAVDEVNETHPKIGDQPVLFTLVSEDDGGNMLQASTVAQRLASIPVVGVIGHLNSSTSVLAARIYQKAGIPQIVPSATATRFTRQGINSAFRVLANDAQLGKELAQYAVKKLHAKSIAVIDDRSTYGQGLADEFKKTALANGGKIVTHEYTNDRATDFRAILTQIKSKQPDMIFFGGMDFTAGQILRQLQQLGVSAYFMGGDGTCTIDLPNFAGRAIGNGKTICAKTGRAAQGDAASRLADFQKKFKLATNTDFRIAPFAYDATRVMIAAMQNAGSYESKAIAPALHSIRYEGVTGPISFDSYGDLKDAPITFYTFKESQMEALETILSSGETIPATEGKAQKATPVNSPALTAPKTGG